MTNIPTLQALLENTGSITAKKIRANFEKMRATSEIDLVHFVGPCIISTKSGTLYVLGPVKGIYDLYGSSGALRDIIRLPAGEGAIPTFDEGIFIHSKVVADEKTKLIYSRTERDEDGDVVLRSELPKPSSVISEIRIAVQENIEG